MVGGMIGVWVVVVIVVRDLIEPRASRRVSRESDALSLLDERLARGEIDEDEYVRDRRRIVQGQ
jgi:uncharacterized membrane protein